MKRANRAEVRNPILALPEAQELIRLMRREPELRHVFKRLMRELKAHCRVEEERCYRQRKGPLVAYWMAGGTIVGHIANVLAERKMK